MRHLIALWLILAGTVSSIAHAGTVNVPTMNDKEVTQLNELVTVIDQGASEKYLLSHLRSKSCAVRAISAALLYRGNQQAYESDLYQAFAVDDYAARAKGKYNFTSKDSMLAVIRGIEERYPRITDQRTQLLLAFCAFKNKNTWIRSDNGNISVARFFRTAFLVAAY